MRSSPGVRPVRVHEAPTSMRDREQTMAADATMDAGIFDGPAKILVDAVRSGPVDPTSVSKHFVGNVTVEVNLSEHVARAECYCFGGSRSQTSDGTTVERTTHVRYVDRFEERSGEWRIRRRVVAYDWSTTAPVTGENLIVDGGRWLKYVAS